MLFLAAACYFSFLNSVVIHNHLHKGMFKTKALNRGLDVMIFSDNVPIEAEIALKQQGREEGRLVMGPDCKVGHCAAIGRDQKGSQSDEKVHPRSTE